jgi:ribosome-associated protein
VIQVASLASTPLSSFSSRNGWIRPPKKYGTLSRVIQAEPTAVASRNRRAACGISRAIGPASCTQGCRSARRVPAALATLPGLYIGPSAYNAPMADEGDIPVRRGVVIPAAEIEETASRSGGPGGQHVNKSNTRVTLRWCLRESRALDPTVRRRVEERLGARVTRAGELIVHAGAPPLARAQPRARARAARGARARRAAHARAARADARGAGVRARGRDAKRQHSAKKRARRPVRRDEDA